MTLSLDILAARMRQGESIPLGDTARVAVALSVPAILQQLDRGVTILNGAGGYTHDPSAVLLSVISSRELPRLEKLVHAIDPACFLIVSQVTEVRGRGFSMDKKYQ